MEVCFWVRVLVVLARLFFKGALFFLSMTLFSMSPFNMEGVMLGCGGFRLLLVHFLLNPPIEVELSSIKVET